MSGILLSWLGLGLLAATWTNWLIYRRRYICYSYSCCFSWTHPLKSLLLQPLALSLAAFIEPLVHRRNVASLRLFYRYYFGKCPSELDTLTAFLYSRRRFTRYSNSLPNSPVTIPTCYARVISFFFFFVLFCFCTTLDSGFLWPQNAFLWPMI